MNICAFVGVLIRQEYLFLTFFLSLFLSFFLSFSLSLFLSFSLSFFLSFFLSLFLSFFLSFLVWNHPSTHCMCIGLLVHLTTHIHTTIGRTPLDERLARRREFWQHTTLPTGRHPCPRQVSNRNPSKRVAVDLDPRQRGPRDRPSFPTADSKHPDHGRRERHSLRVQLDTCLDFYLSSIMLF